MLECPRTTCVACVIQDGKAYWAHSGDSRLYLFRAGKVAAATLDHSRVQQLIDAGMITQEMAATHPDRNKIYNCLGGVLLPEVTLSQEYPLEPGDTILLSTDGFWAQIPTALLASKLQRDNILTLMPQLLEEAERSAGAESDNLSVVAMTLESQDDDEVATQSMTTTAPMDGFHTQSNMGQDSPAPGEVVTDEEIERAIAEIQTAIKKK
jgi:PPM family protein phosphatase